MFETINSEIKLGGIALKNRVIFAPTTMGLSKEKYFEKLKDIAKGGVSMIIIGDVPVLKSNNGKSLYSKKGFKDYRELTSIMHSQNCLICAQLHQSDTTLKSIVRAMFKVSFKNFSFEQFQLKMSEEVSPYISGMSIEKVKEITSSFGDTAVLAKEAGFDMVQVHGDRMCGSFSSEIFNKRTDEYGGTAENRARFAVESIESIRKKLPDYPIDYKLAVRQENPHYGNAGVLESELTVFVPMLEKVGVTSFQVTLANHSKLTDTIPQASHQYFSQEGCFLKFCDEVKKLTNLPICGVGNLSSPKFVEEQLSTGRIDCVSMCRQLIADSNWVQKTTTGNVDEIKLCVRCNKDCVGGLLHHQGVHCIFDEKK